MIDLATELKQLQGGNESVAPIIFDLNQVADKQALSDLLESKAVESVVDTLEESIEELFKIDFPFVGTRTPEYAKTLADYRFQVMAGRSPEAIGVWIYLPWRRSLVHLPEEALYFKLRTARNKLVVTESEQRLFYDSTVGIAGLSVGSSAVHSLALAGGAQRLRLADHDFLSPSNLNRLQASVSDLTKSKAIVMARRVYEINPFQQIQLFPDGLTDELFDQFFLADNQPLDLFIEEMDDIRLKIASRLKARQLKIPVIMGSDDGDNAIIDVERFDLEPTRPLFHGRVDEKDLVNIPAKLSLSEKANLAIKIVGTDITPRMQQSMMLVGSQLAGIPQLGTGANLTGIGITYAARRILTGAPMPSGRYVIHIDSALDPDFKATDRVEQRRQQKADFEEGFNLVFGGGSDE
jgi:molybdopterin/thiamine biosynthesis adenylyltransferase